MLMPRSEVKMELKITSAVNGFGNPANLDGWREALTNPASTATYRPRLRGHSPYPRIGPTPKTMPRPVSRPKISDN